MKIISKSKYLSGLQCEKLLWYHYNDKDSIPQPDQAQQAIFDQGHLVGDYAKKLFPGGIEIEWDTLDYSQTIERTRECLKLRIPVFEASLIFDNAYARADILVPVNEDKWDLIEVKSSTEVKTENICDMSIQKYIFAGAGLKIRDCILMHINNKYERFGDINPDQLFTFADKTAQVDAGMKNVRPNLQKIRSIISTKSIPDIKIGPQCKNPYTCPLIENCWSFLPDNNVNDLYRLGDKAFDLMDNGILKITDIPEDYKLSGTQRIQYNSLKNKNVFIDKPEIKLFLKQLVYPLFFLDFETFNTAIPLFDNVRPYQNVPFQFSVHIIEKEGSKPVHKMYLADGKNDPRYEIMESLIPVLGNKGSIIAYNAAFEKNILCRLTELFPQHSQWYTEIEQRIIDLYAPFRSFHYYNPVQNGSASIKEVLPAITGKGYEDMEIADGGTASQEFMRITFNEVTPEERERVRKNLEKYCEKDTYGMIEILYKLREIII